MSTEGHATFKDRQATSDDPVQKLLREGIIDIKVRRFLWPEFVVGIAKDATPDIGLIDNDDDFGQGVLERFEIRKFFERCLCVSTEYDVFNLHYVKCIRLDGLCQVFRLNQTRRISESLLDILIGISPEITDMLRTKASAHI